MDLRQLRYFAAVVAAGSLTGAAVDLRMSQPPLSIAIRKLEVELGVELLVRTPRGVEPTGAGRFLLEASARILDEVDDVISALRRFGSGLSGSLTLAAVPVLMWHRVPVLLRHFAMVAPDVEVRLIDPPPWTGIDMLHDRRADVAAVNVLDPVAFAGRNGGACEIADWGPVPLVGVLSPSDDLPAGALSPDYFSGRTIVLPRRVAAVSSVPEAIDAFFDAHGVVPAQVRTAETIQSSIPLIESGTAVAILPDPDRLSLRRFDVQVREIDPAPSPLRSLVLTRSGGSNPAVRLLLQAVARVRRDADAHAAPTADRRRLLSTTDTEQ